MKKVLLKAENQHVLSFSITLKLPSGAIKNQGKEPALKSVAEGPMTNIMQ